MTVFEIVNKVRADERYNIVAIVQWWHCDSAISSLLQRGGSMLWFRSADAARLSDRVPNTTMYIESEMLLSEV